MLFIIKLLFLAYVISLVVMYVVARSAIRDRSWWMIFSLLAAVVPFLALLAAVRNLIHPRKQRLQFVAEIAVVEDAIEAERVKIFGVDPLNPSFAERWQNSCQLDVQRVVVWSNKASRR